MGSKYTAVYLVDCENVGISSIGVGSESLVFYFTSNKTIKGKLAKNEREVHIYHENQKDALDFVIDTKLGQLVTRYGKSVDYYIISNDKCYEIVRDFWRLQGYSVHCESSEVTKDDFIKLVSAKELSTEVKLVKKPSTGLKPVEVPKIDTKATLEANYNKIVSKLSDADKKKLDNIHKAWLSSKKHTVSKLNNKLKASHLGVVLGSADLSFLSSYLVRKFLDTSADFEGLSKKKQQAVLNIVKTQVKNETAFRKQMHQCLKEHLSEDKIDILVQDFINKSKKAI